MALYRLAGSANRDIDGILAAILPENADAAWRWYVSLHEKLRALAHSPRMGRVRDDLPPDLRMFPFGNYLNLTPTARGPTPPPLSGGHEWRGPPGSGKVTHGDSVLICSKGYCWRSPANNQVYLHGI